jgi:RNA polymerase-binding transcription factor
MNYQTLETFRRKLLGRRLTLLQRRQRVLSDEQQLRAEREPDWEDAAAVETAATVLEGISEAERHALARINASLARIERGSYGECAVCRDAIDEERLRAVPDTDRCGRCAAAH